MTLNTFRPDLRTAATGHPRLYPVHSGHLYAGDLVREPIRLRPGSTVLGSDPGTDVVLADLAPRHAEIRCDEHDEFVLRPLGGPATVNGSSRPAARLHTGDLVRLGPLAFSFARDESTDHPVDRHFRHLDPPHGVIARWERLLFSMLGPGTHAPAHRHDDRHPDQPVPPNPAA
jgi:predicted component of type VI protein secretion system